MRATVMYGAGDVRVETVPDAGLVEPTDALSTAASPPPAPTSRNCCRTCWQAGSSRVASSTGSATWTQCRTATGR